MCPWGSKNTSLNALKIAVPSATLVTGAEPCMAPIADVAVTTMSEKPAIICYTSLLVTYIRSKAGWLVIDTHRKWTKTNDDKRPIDDTDGLSRNLECL
jgi:hypothetical protein